MWVACRKTLRLSFSKYGVVVIYRQLLLAVGRYSMYTKRLAISAYMSDFLLRPDITLDRFIFYILGTGEQWKYFFCKFSISSFWSNKQTIFTFKEQWIHVPIKNPSNVKKS